MRFLPLTGFKKTILRIATHFQNQAEPGMWASVLFLRLRFLTRAICDERAVPRSAHGVNMETVTYQKGTWKAETHAEELAGGKYQGVVLLFHEGEASGEQILRRTIDASDSVGGALAEARGLAIRLLDEL